MWELLVSCFCEFCFLFGCALQFAVAVGWRYVLVTSILLSSSEKELEFLWLLLYTNAMKEILFSGGVPKEAPTNAEEIIGKLIAWQ